MQKVSSVRRRKRIILAARYYSIEPLGILYLAGLVRDAGWECDVVLVKEFDFTPLYETVRRWQPDYVGFQVWTGYHTQAFVACDEVRRMGISVIIGGPHATYFDKECAQHADFVVKGSGFGLLRQILNGELASGVHFEKSGRSEPFPLPDRNLVYEKYPELGASPIKSVFTSVGCPFTCTYCYAPSFNQMHGGFSLTLRPVDEVIIEAKAIQARWPLSMPYIQDDIFGYDKHWLEEFARRWPQEIGVPFHAQIRLELTRHDAGNRRLDLFKQAGCSGITLAIESGNTFLRDRVLFRHMPNELILEGCKKIMDHGMTLRTEQILAVPFSDAETDLATLDLNSQINPTMAWTSILAPYGGTDMGTIASNFGLYMGNNDDLSESFFDRSVLRHIAGGPRDIEPVVEKLGVSPSAKPEEQPLVNMQAVAHDGSVADVFYHAVKKQKGGGYEKVGTAEKVGTVEYLGEKENEQYCSDIVRLQRLFNFLAKVPEAKRLGQKILCLNDNEWGWEKIGETVTSHLGEYVASDTLEERTHALAREMNLPYGELPWPIAQNPHYFCAFPSGGTLAQKVVEEGVFNFVHAAEVLDMLNTLTRRHLFHFGLYKIEEGKEPIAAQ